MSFDLDQLCDKNTTSNDLLSLSSITFGDHELLLDSVRKKALAQGYSMKIKQSKKNNSCFSLF